MNKNTMEKKNQAAAAATQAALQKEAVLTSAEALPSSWEAQPRASPPTR